MCKTRYTGASTKRILHLLLATVSLLTGCCKSGNDSEDSEVAPNPTVFAPLELTLENPAGALSGNTTCKSTLTRTGAKEPIDICDSKNQTVLGDGTVRLGLTSKTAKKATLGPASAKFEGGKADLRVDLKPSIAKLSIRADLSVGGYPLELPLVVTTPDGRWSGQVAFNKDAVTVLFEQVKKGPVALPGDTGSSGAKSSMLFQDGQGGWNARGGDPPIANVDLLGLATPVERKGASCTYRGAAGTKTISIKYTDLNVAVFERRTGSKLGQRLLKAKSVGCDAYIRSYESALPSTVDKSVLAEWMESFLEGDWKERDNASNRARAAADLKGAKGAAKLYSFVGLRYGDTKERALALFGKQSSVGSGIYGFGGVLSCVTASFDKKGRVETLSIEDDCAIEFLKEHKIQEPILALYGKKIDAFVAQLGPHKPDPYENMYEWEHSSSDGRSLKLTVSCVDFNQFACKSIGVHWFYRDN